MSKDVATCLQRFFAVRFFFASSWPKCNFIFKYEAVQKPEILLTTLAAQSLTVFNQTLCNLAVNLKLVHRKRKQNFASTHAPQKLSDHLAQ